MKFLVIFFLFSINVYSNDNFCFSKQEFKKFYYANGILNELDKEVDDGIRDLKNSFNIKDITSLYNPTHGFLKDVSETMDQINIDRIRTKYYQERSISVRNDDVPTSIVKGFLETLEQTKYKKHFIFAHSQGNLFTNYMCDLKDNDLHMEVFSIAPPTESLKCNSLNSYILFSNDDVINSLRIKSLLHIGDQHKSLKSNYTNTIFTLDITHHFLSTYLNDVKAFSYLQEQLTKTVDMTYKKYYIDPVIATLEIKPDSTLDKAIDSIKDTKESVSLWMREKKAFMNTVNYASSFTDVTKYKTKNGIKKLLATPIPAEDEQEFADMIAYSLNAIASQCNKNLSPNLAKLCHKVELKTYFDNKDKIDPYLETSQFKDTKFLLSCENIVRFYETLKEPTLEVKLNFAKKSPVITFNNQDQDLKLVSNEPISISKPIGEFKFSKDQEPNEYSVNFNFKPQEVKCS